MGRKLVDLDIRKKMHVKILTETHAGLKMRAAEMKLSMQSIIEELVSKVVEGDPYIISLLEDMKMRNINKEVRALAEADADSILDYIEKMDMVDKLMEEEGTEQ